MSEARGTGSRARRTSREAMLNAASGVDITLRASPASVQQVKNPRPASFATRSRELNRTLDGIQPKHAPQALWFIAGTLALLALTVYNAAQFLKASGTS